MPKSETQPAKPAADVATAEAEMVQADPDKVIELQKRITEMQGQSTNLRNRIQELTGYLEKSSPELERLTAENAALKSAKAQADKEEALILEKINAGLTRTQAIDVIKRQRAAKVNIEQQQKDHAQAQADLPAEERTKGRPWHGKVKVPAPGE